MASPREPIRYTLTVPDPETHFLEVEATLPAEGRDSLELFLPVWTPGSYKIRDHSRHLEGLAAEDLGGEPLTVAPVAKNRWRVTTPGGPRVHLRYRVYARELSVRTNFVDRDFALVNGAATFVTMAGETDRPHEVDVVVPRTWKRVYTALTSSRRGGPHRFRADDYDTLVDSPLYLGTPRVHRFDVRGISHTLVEEGTGELWDARGVARDVERITREVVGFWGEIPYARYCILNLIVGGRGGLEHRDCCVLMTDRWQVRRRDGYVDWLGLVAHELFHAWNGKRLRPVELGPFDYEREVYTRSLWVVEGFTSYYDDLLVHRAGLSNETEYLAQLSKNVRQTQESPGRRVRSLEASSFDAWVKLYQPDENTKGSAVSYYRKGAVVALLLDARIRRLTDHARSLDDALRLAYQRFSGAVGYQPAELEAVLSEVAGEDLTPFLDVLVRGTDELPYLEATELFGLRFATQENGGEPPGWLGVSIEVREGQLRVTEVARGGPGFRAGLDVDDELLALDGYRVPPRGLSERLATYRPGSEVLVLVARRERLLELATVLADDPSRRWRLEPDPEATTGQVEARRRWLAAGAAISSPSPSSAS